VKEITEKWLQKAREELAVTELCDLRGFACRNEV